MVRKVLCTMVRDEEKTLPRCFSTTKFCTDLIALDTGSLDNTLSILRDEIQAKKDQHGYSGGRVGTAPWIDVFDHTRNKGVDMAYQYLSDELGPVSYAEYQNLEPVFIFFTDADDQYLGEISEQEFTGDIILADRCLSLSSPERWDSCLAVRYHPSQRYRWSSDLHEAIGEVDHQVIRQKLPPPALILSTDDGFRGRNPATFEKDCIIMKRALIKRPWDTRMWYYLAQSYKDAGRWKDAITTYLKVAEMNGFLEERYISYLTAARLIKWYRDLTTEKNQMRFVRYLSKAIQICPGRMDAPYYLIEFYRTQDMFVVGAALGSRWIGQHEVASKYTLLVDQSIWKWKFYDTLAVNAYWAGNKPLCKIMSQECLKHSDVIPAEHLVRIKTNIGYCE